MSIIDLIKQGIDNLTTTHSERFQKDLTPENALEKLESFNLDPKIIRIARNKNKLDSGLEWLLNSFQFTSYKIPENQILTRGKP